jgi:hypothetical protein
MEGLFVAPVEDYSDLSKPELRVLRISATGSFQIP